MQDPRRPGFFEYALLTVLVLAMIVDGLDMQLLSLVAPLILADWHIDKATFGPAMSAALIGMSVGAVAGGWLGDRMGRKTVLVASVVLFGLSTMLVSLTHGMPALVALRFIGGFSFGATAPNTITLLSEYLPMPLRARGISLMSIGTPIGGMLGAVLLAALLPFIGWRGSFLLFGGVSLLMAFAVLWIVPGGDRAALGGAAADGEFPVTWRFRIGNWLAFFCTTYVAYGCTAWVPTLTTMNQLPLKLGLDAMFWFNLMAMGGAATGGFLVTLLGSRRMLPGAAVVVGIGVALLMTGMGPAGRASELALDLGVAIVGGGTAMLLATMYFVLAQGYPGARRASGVGVGMLLGRFGGVASSWFGGQLLGATIGDSMPFFVSLLAAVGGILAGLFIIDRHVPRSRP
ncbi:MAG: hypothetical protein RLZZ200_1499 [Pseudomonadota bacterium]|jgi:AAHS family 4-hydroxybenzoate transporter-like MFS transporter